MANSVYDRRYQDSYQVHRAQRTILTGTSTGRRSERILLLLQIVPQVQVAFLLVNILRYRTVVCSVQSYAEHFVLVQSLRTVLGLHDTTAALSADFVMHYAPAC
jgi:hypothetical protein